MHRSAPVLILRRFEELPLDGFDKKWTTNASLRRYVIFQGRRIKKCPFRKWGVDRSTAGNALISAVPSIFKPRAL